MMPVGSSKLTSKGQITLPAALRRSLNLKPGDTVSFRETGQGNYELVAKPLSLDDLRGILKLASGPRSTEQIVDDVKEARRLRAETIAKQLEGKADR